MAFLSIVLPCHGVQAYLRECLDSLLDQPFTDIEVIGINDASPDHSGAILDEYAARDSRLRVIHLTENQGLGEGRNIGLDHATGEYVMFVDSDDWIADGGVAAIAERLQETKPDVLFFDYARSYWGGRVQRNVLNHLFRDPPAPDVFTLAERPSVMRIMMTAWNKAYRREFLLGLGLRFSRGYYEDLVVTYPTLMVAERISLLDRVCYYYRQRRAGAITKTPGRKHFAAFDQYAQIFAWMDAEGPKVDEFRPLMFERMIWHYLVILRNNDRVPKEAREDFFDRIVDHYRRFKPQDFTPPEDEETTYKLLERGAYRAFELQQEVTLRSKQVRSARNKVVRRARKVKGRTRRRLQQSRYRKALQEPIDEQLAVFACYWYRAPTGNPLAIYQALRKFAPHIRAVWIVNPEEVERVPSDYEYVVVGTSEYFDVLAHAKYLVNDVNFPNFVEKRAGSIHLQTQHGTPLKTMGMDLREFPLPAKTLDFGALLKRAQRWDYNLSSNAFSSAIWRRTYPVDFVNLDYGYPRNDRFYTATADEVLALREMIGIPPDKTAILYAPTHREYRNAFELQLDLARVLQAMPDDQILLLRAHYFYDEVPEFADLERSGQLIDVSSHLHTEDLCLAADVLLTDYSSISFDYANLGRPIVIYADDYETYRLLRGTYFDLLEAPPGPVATTEDELIEILAGRRFDDADMDERLESFRRRFCDFDDGRSAERVVRKVFLDEEPDPVLPLEQRTPAPPPRALLSKQ